MTDLEFQGWLKQTGVARLVLVEASVNSGGQEVTRYLSSKAYNTRPDDVPANQHYDPVVAAGVAFTEQLSLTGAAGLSYGDIEIQNINGVRDSWLDDIWMNRSIRIFIGSPDWRRADFRMIFNGVAADIAPKSRDTLAIKLRDKLQLLNMPVSELTLGGATANKDAIIPLTFGECHNVTPLLVDPANLEYQVHPGAVERIIEVRDNGLPVDITDLSASGKFRLKASPAGQITASVQGDKATAYSNTIASVIRRIVTGFGAATTRFTDADIDLDNFAAFDAAHPQPVGIYITDRANILTVIQDLAASIGAQVGMSRLGKLQLFQISLPAGAPTFDIQPRHMLQRTFAQTQRTDVSAAIKLGFAKNWTVQAGLQTALPAEHKDLFAQEWLTSTTSDAAVRAAYRLDAMPVQQDTMLLCRVDADAEAARQLAMWKQPRKILEFVGVPELLMLQRGQQVRIFNPRFGCQNGVTGVVMSLAPDYMSASVKVGVIV